MLWHEYSSTNPSRLMSSLAMKDKNVETQDRTDNEGSENYDQGSIGEYLDPEVDTDALVQGLKRGQLTPNQQEALAGLLVEDVTERQKDRS